MTSYQKLKKENERLWHELRTVVLNPNSFEGMAISTSIKIQYQTEKALFYGSVTKCDSFNGLITSLK